ncbi:MAG: primosomal protein N' [Tidjanibacter sp.]|nr:primosomal protein N' [Tidjanibacter sp.]
MENLYADIVVPLALRPLTFAIAPDMADLFAVGSGVEVPIGNKIYTGIIKRIHTVRPPYKKIREVMGVVRSEPLASAEQLALWKWIADYYMCTEGEVMRAALPSLLKPSAATDDLFAERVFSLGEVQYLSLAPSLRSEEALSEALDALLPRRKARYAAMMEFFEVAGTDRLDAEVPRKALAASTPIVNHLIEDGLLVSTLYERTPQHYFASLQRRRSLSEAQQQALDKLHSELARHNTVLLHGVTGSGKTELYISLAAQALEEGRSVLYLVPELALTEHLIGRLSEAFEGDLTVYHSHLTPRARTEVYIKLSRSEGGHIVVGTRSAVLLPLANLGLVIVDEEHDRSYKQEDCAPRFSARDTAVWMASNLGAKTVLGSATPSLESFQNARIGKYGYVPLGERYGEGQLPWVMISDTIRSAKRGERRGHINKELADEIGAAIAEGRQVMLFQNRRGFAPYIECPDCGWSGRCPKCGVTLTFYKSDRKMRCNLCGYTSTAPTKCPSCHTAEPQPQGFGTEKIEEAVQELFPTARVSRLDGDTASSGGRMRSIINSFESGQTDILVGTTLITKGFDFEGVSVVGVLNADNLLSRPDFRADERTFQTLVQIAGRAGRKDDRGRTIIQTSQPENTTIRQAARGDYYAMFCSQMRDREAFGYPPFARLVVLSLKYNSYDLLLHGARRLASRLKELIGPEAVTDAHIPPVGRTAENFFMEIVVRIERGRSPSEVKSLIREALVEFARDKVVRRIAVAVNVDPQ